MPTAQPQQQPVDQNRQNHPHDYAMKQVTFTLDPQRFQEVERIVRLIFSVKP